MKEIVLGTPYGRTFKGYALGQFLSGQEETFLYISNFEIGREDAFDLCDSLGGQVPLPRNEVKFYQPKLVDQKGEGG